MVKNPITLSVFFALLGLGFLGVLFLGQEVSFLLLLLLGISIVLGTFIKPDFGLVLLILSMLLSPEIRVAEIPGRDVVIRLDDIIIGVVFLSWLARMAIYKELGVFRSTPLNKPIAIYATCCLLFTVFGMMRGDVVPSTGFFYVMKYLQFFLVYFMTINLLKSKKQLKLYLLFLFITCAVVSLYAAGHIGTLARIAAPFEGKPEPNTLGGYFIIMTALAIGILAYKPPQWMKFSLLGLVSIASVCVAYSLSRATYMSFPFMYLSILFFSEKKKELIAGFLVIILALVVTRPQVIIDRIVYTFVTVSPEIEPETVFGIQVGPSASARIASWREALETSFPEHPVIGTGTTGYKFLDGQYVRTLIELGILGLLALLFLLWVILKNLVSIIRNTPPGIYKGLALGTMGAFVGISVQAITVNSFMIVRIMQPLMFLIAMTMSIRQLRVTGGGRGQKPSPTLTRVEGRSPLPH